MSQYLNEGIFRDHLVKYGVKIELGTEPESVEQDIDGVNVTLKKIDETGNETLERIRARYIIGADGARGKAPLVVNNANLLTTTLRCYA